MNGYLYEPHSHTAQTSKCGHVNAEDMVDFYVKDHYTGLVVTDHLHPEYLSRIDTQHNWDFVMDHYLAGYHASKKRGDEVGFDVILGAELRFPENNNDYLVYGIDENWLRCHPYVCCTSAQEFYNLYHDEVLIIHAHPFRENSAPVQESAIHGAELINANPRHDNNTDKGLSLCLRHPEYIRSAGSDAHRVGDDGRAGIILPERVKDSYQFKQMLQARRFRLWSPSNQQYVEADEAIRSEEGR